MRDSRVTFSKRARGVTLIEILLVIAILSILAGITIFAINPVKHLRDARDSERMADVYTIMNALHQYAADNDGAFPASITSEEREICRTGAASCNGLHNLSSLTDSERYLISIPLDPLCGTGGGHCSENGAGYNIRKTSTGRMNIIASSSENTVIDITR